MNGSRVPRVSPSWLPSSRSEKISAMSNLGRCAVGSSSSRRRRCGWGKRCRHDNSASTGSRLRPHEGQPLRGGPYQEWPRCSDVVGSGIRRPDAETRSLSGPGGDPFKRATYRPRSGIIFLATWHAGCLPAREKIFNYFHFGC